MLSVENSQEALQIIEHSFQNQKDIKIYPQGTSMFPLLLEKRDSVILSPVKNQTFRKGDLLLYQRENGLLVLHRLCFIKKDGLYFTGDNQTEIEGPLTEKQVIGVVTEINRKQHTFSTRNIIYVLYSRFWLLLRPIRPQIAKIAKKLVPGIDKL
ncbi:MAG: S24/S26 family peptidase [Butyribacter sp.]|nr:S24/S26 family peptidase [Butyribacter sp.]